MIHFNAVEFARGVTGGAEVVERMTDALGPMQRCVFLYEQHFCPRYVNGQPENGGLPTFFNNLAMKRRIAALLKSKSVTRHDLVVLDCEATLVEWDTAPRPAREDWTAYNRSNPFFCFQSMYQEGYDRRTLNDSLIAQYTAAVEAARKFTPDVAYYDCCPSLGWLGHPEEGQRKRWRGVTGRDTQSIYPRNLHGAFTAYHQNVRPVEGEPFRKMTLIQSPLYQDVAGPLRGRPLSSEDVEFTVNIAGGMGYDLIWWLPVFTQDQSDALRCSGVFEAMKAARARFESVKGVEGA